MSVDNNNTTLPKLRNQNDVAIDHLESVAKMGR